jgi:hypothetical protein
MAVRSEIPDMSPRFLIGRSLAILLFLGCLATNGQDPLTATEDQNPGVIRIQWTAIQGATNYEVWRGETPTRDTAVPIKTNAVPVTIYDDQAQFQLQYNYWIRGILPDGQETWVGPVAAAQQSKRWEYAIGATITASPSILPSGRIIVASHGALNKGIADPGKITALTHDGVLEWAYTGPKAFASAPAVSDAGVTYAICADQYLYAISPAGEFLWKFPVGGFAPVTPWQLAPAIAPNGNIIAPGKSGIVALSTNGIVLWTYPVICNSAYSPVIGSDGAIYMMTGATGPHAFVALNPDGTLRWALPDSLGFASGPSLMSDDAIIILGNNGIFLYEFGRDGSTNRAVPTAGSHPTGVLRITPSNEVVLTELARISALPRNGTETATVGLAQQLFADDPLSVTASGNLLIALQPQSQQVQPVLLSFSSGSFVTNVWGRGTATPVTFARQGDLVFGTSAGIVYSIVSSAQPATNGWPLARFDALQDGQKPVSPQPSAPVFDDTSTGLLLNATRMSWAPVEGAVTYEVWRSTNSNLNDAIPINTNVFAHSFDDRSVDPGTSYHYWLRSRTENAVSPFSDGVSRVTASGAQPLWVKPISEPVPLLVLGRDKSIYGGSSGRRVYAWTPTGELKWSRDSVNYDGQVVIAPDNNIHSWNGTSWIITDPQGAEVRREQLTTGQSSCQIVISQDGIVYLTTFGVTVKSLTGTLQWSAGAVRSMALDPLGNPFGLVTLVSVDPAKAILAFTQTGAERWRYDFTNTASTLVIAGTNKVVSTTASGKLIILESPNTVLGAFDSPTVKSYTGTPLIAPDGTVVASVDGIVYALRPDGSVRWTYPGGAPGLIAQDGTILLLSTPGIVALTIDGAILWQYAVSPPGSADGVATPPVLADDGTLYFSAGTLMFAVQTPLRAALNSWSAVRGNMQRTSQLLSASPPAQPSLSLSENSNDGTFVLHVDAPNASKVRIDQSSDLINWTLFDEVALTGGSIDRTLSAPAASTFYRCVSFP